MPKKRTVQQEVLEGLPELAEGQVVARVVQAKGNHLYEVELAGGETTLCKMPSKFRSLVWVKRGDYVVSAINESTTTKVSGDIVHILYPDQIKHLKTLDQWPAEFASTDDGDDGSDDESDADEDGLFANPNRRGGVESSEDDDDGEDDEDDGDAEH